MRKFGHRALGIVIIARDLADLMGPAVKWLQDAYCERPAALLNPGTRFEVHRIERPTPATPGVGASTEIAELTDVQREVGHADIAPGVQGLARPGEFNAAALQQTDGEPPAGQFQRQTDSGGPRPAH